MGLVAPHSDTLADHFHDLKRDFAAHTPDEQAHIMQGLFERGAAVVCSMSGDPTMNAIGRSLDAKADDDFKNGHLSFHDYSDIFKTIDHIV